ncbi:unnamed protein product [Pseudo-nitzschia multistriata]|uniref:Sulfatase N-terminal domain-containing protein n=1 Tax=Pseudo-nitzschia multistriata TaxID=183589 RepID=A0A448Z7S3_9STRA|nr:unnamed protein product [Pseudo-nitzschia multistriata]
MWLSTEAPKEQHNHSKRNESNKEIHKTMATITTNRAPTKPNAGGKRNANPSLLFPTFFLVLTLLVRDRSFGGLGVVGAAGQQRQQQQQKPPKQLPHIVMIVLDDLGSHDLGLHGTGIHTPNIDGFVAEARNRNVGESYGGESYGGDGDGDERPTGIYLEQYYVLPYCSPTRAALLSGMYPLRTGVHNVIIPKSTAGLPLDVETLPEMLKRAGTKRAGTAGNNHDDDDDDDDETTYRTHAVGKWHLGHSAWEQTPTFRGFDSFFGFYMGGQDYFTHESDASNGVGGVDLHRDARPRCGEGCSRVVGSERGNYSTHVFTREAIAVVEDHAAEAAATNATAPPLFLYLAYQAVHCPNEVPKEYVDRYKARTNWTDQRKNYAGMLTAADEGIGNLTASLKDHGLWENTLVVVTTDNGGPTTVGCVQGSSNFPKRGGKCSLWEGGTTGDALVGGPALEGLLLQQQQQQQQQQTTGEKRSARDKRNHRDGAGGATENAAASSNTGGGRRRYNNLFHVVDWFPTLAEWVGVVPRNQSVQDGVSQATALLSALPGGSRGLPPPPRTELFGGYAMCVDHDPGRGTPDWYGPAIRHRNWKLVYGSTAGPDASNKFPEGSDSIVPPGEDHHSDGDNKNNHPHGNTTRLPREARYLLFDLATDPGETSDLAGKYPEVLRDMVEKLRLYRKSFVYPQINDDSGCPFPGLVNTSDAGPAWIPWCKDLQETILALQ